VAGQLAAGLAVGLPVGGGGEGGLGAGRQARVPGQLADGQRPVQFGRVEWRGARSVCGDLPLWAALVIK
jgi:hypothetical protein